jgi:mono/diheme cytochrome c family protein
VNIAIAIVLAAASTAPGGSLAFVRDGREVSTLSQSQMEAKVPAQTFKAYDPYYQREKTWRAVPLGKLLVAAFGAPASELAKLDFVLRAKDGYAVPIKGARLFEKGGYVAVADVEVPGWEPIGEQHANPGPFYVVWRESSQRSLETHPRPWQLAAIEISPFDKTYPHAIPTSLSSNGQAMRGAGLFLGECIKCHAINREGGRVGPDLNVPRSIVEYRPRAQIRAYIKDPRTFRYSNMPAHPQFTSADLDALLAYFDAMKTRKFDPEAARHSH